MKLRVAIIGASRRKQGTGPYVARIFHELGHTVSAFVGTSTATIEETQLSLRSQYGIEAQGFTSLTQLLDQRTIDVIAICSPATTHAEYLREALKTNCAIFCEKPFLWSHDTPVDSCVSETQKLIHVAQKKGTYIHLNTQWPYTLPYFHQLYPSTKTDAGNINHFSMLLSPNSAGPSMIVDSASHLLSMLYHLMGTGELQSIQWQPTFSDNTRTARLNFVYCHHHGATNVVFDVCNSSEIPKPAAYAINHCRVDRRVAMPDYVLKLARDNTEIDMIDPLELSIRDFIAGWQAGLTSDYASLAAGMKHLSTLVNSSS